MSVFEALMLAINVALLVIAIINANRKDRP
ncbi:putative holin-like toxin [Kyrpidia sp.]|nr:putative holin-like toxin [Kyrpidia sp.]MCL6577613.1 putative holin-like toxin [Kyrpidia sp.]